MEIHVSCTKSARDQLAVLHLKYRGVTVAQAESKICNALEQNPTGGSPISKSLWAVKVHPLRAIDRIDGNQVVIVAFEDSPPLTLRG